MPLGTRAPQPRARSVPKPRALGWGVRGAQPRQGLAPPAESTVMARPPLCRDSPVPTAPSPSQKRPQLPSGAGGTQPGSPSPAGHRGVPELQSRALPSHPAGGPQNLVPLPAGRRGPTHGDSHPTGPKKPLCPRNTRSCPLAVWGHRGKLRRAVGTRRWPRGDHGEAEPGSTPRAVGPGCDPRLRARPRGTVTLGTPICAPPPRGGRTQLAPSRSPRCQHRLPKPEPCRGERGGVLGSPPGVPIKGL